jgi:hypothetical protein
MRETSERVMNHSIASADRNTQVKIVVVALVAAIMVVIVGISARVATSGIELAGVDPAPAATKVGVVRADKPVNWSARENSAIR